MGLIPAHAGKTHIDWGERVTDKAHPRSRGENPRTGLSEGWVQGSSPLTRGKRTSYAETVPHIGLIPAHAGKTMSWLSDTLGQGAHPRSRGENPAQRMTGVRRAGSSPLTRGKHRCEQRPGYRTGLIPAHAGKTYFLG